MNERPIDHTKLSEDWEGNNIAIQCPACGKVYIVSEQIHSPKRGEAGERTCPCGKSKGRVKGGRKSGGSASVFY
jgi:hypothetical protein